jgi:hypothetical protein
MKNVTLRSNIILSSLLVILSASTYAQSSQSLFANVPFDFFLEGKKIPAGEYSVERLNRQSTYAAVVLKRKSDGRSMAMISGLISDVSPGWDARLTFDRIASTYYLVGIQNPAANYALNLPRTKRGVAAAGKLSGIRERVTLVLRD